MAQYDGSIRINTKISTNDAKVQLSALAHTIVKTADEIKSLQSKMDALKDVKVPTKEFTNLEKEIKKAVSEYEKLQSKMDEPGKPTERYKALQKELGKAQAQLEELAAQQAEIEELGFSLQPESIKQLADASDKVDAIKEKINALEAEGKAFVPKVDTKELEDAKNKVEELKQKMKELKASGGDTMLGQDTEEYANLSKQLKSEQKALAKYTLQFMSAGASGILSGAKSAYKKLADVAKSTFSKITKSIKSSSEAVSSLGSRFKSLAVSLLIFNQISKAFNAMARAIKEGFGSLYKEADSFKASVDGLKAGVLTLKNSFAAAFRPLVEVAIPYIQKTIDALSNLMNIIGQFTAAVTGQKNYTKAVRQTTAAIEDENKAQNKQLSGLDKLNNLSSGSSGSADSGVSTQMFEENVPISSPMLDMYQNLKDLIESEDWEGLGAYIAGALNQGLQKIYDVINWDNVGPQITYFVTAFTGAFNGLVDGFNWELLGQTIGAGINTIVNSLTLLVTGIDWVNLGKSLAAGLNGIVNEVNFENLGNLIGQKFMVLPRILLGFVTNLDWAAIGDQIGNALNGVVGAIDLSQIGTLLGTSLTGIFQMAINFAATFDWEALGTNIFQGINAFFASTDWATVGQGISDFAMGLLDALLVAVSGIDWGELGKSIIEFILAIDWLGLVVKLAEIGYQLIYGLCDGILGALAAIGTWLKENVFDPIVGWFKDLFGIHSPSTVFAELGTYLIEGLFIGISSLVDTIKEIWAGMKDTAVSIWTAVKDKISSIVSNIKSVITSALTLIKTIWSTSWTMVRTIATQVWTGIKQNISSIINSVKTVISTALTLIKKTWDTAWTGMKNTVVNIFNAIWSAIKGVINSILGGIEGMANGVINGINSMIGALNSIHFDIPDWVPGLGGKSLGFNIGQLSQVSIPRLATGTVVPPNNEFMAVLGDNKREPEIVSPISTMKQAFLEAIAEAGDINGNRDINLQVTVECEGYKLLQLIQKLDLAQYKRTGRPSFRV